MKTNILFLLTFLLLATSGNIIAQPIDPLKSANAAAISDKQLIALNIQDNQDDLALSQRALQRAADPRIKELAQQMVEDHTGIIYAFQELNAAGSSDQSAAAALGNAHKAAAELDGRLSGVSGSTFDTIWVANMLTRKQAKFDELTIAKTTVTNPQLQRAVSDAIPLLKKQRTQLNNLQKEFVKAAMLKKKMEAKRK